LSEGCKRAERQTTNRREARQSVIGTCLRMATLDAAQAGAAIPAPPANQHPVIAVE